MSTQASGHLRSAHPALRSDGQGGSRRQEGISQASRLFLLCFVEVMHDATCDGLEGAWLMVEQDVGQLVSQVAVLPGSVMQRVVHDNHACGGANG